MRTRLTEHRIFPAFALIAAMIIAGCGYSVHRKADLPFTEVSIGRIDNRTVEPKLQDKLHRALVEEFAKQGITVTPSAGHSLSGIIDRFDMKSLSEKKNLTVEYQIFVEADFTFTDSQGKAVVFKKIRSPFIVSFSGSRDMSALLASRDVAEQKAAAEIAMEIVGALIYK